MTISEHRKYHREWARRYRAMNPHKQKEADRRFSERFPGKKAAASRDWKIRNREKVKAYKKSYRERRNELNRLRRLSDARFKIEENIRTRINCALSANGSRTEFSCED